MKMLDKKYIPYINLPLLIFLILLVPVVLQELTGPFLKEISAFFSSLINPASVVLLFSVQESINTYYGGNAGYFDYAEILGYMIIGMTFIFVIAPYFLFKDATVKKDSEETGKSFKWYFGYTVVICSLLITSVNLIRSIIVWQNAKNEAEVSAVHDMIRADLASVSFDVANRILTESYLGEGNEKTTAELLAELKASGFPSEYDFNFEQSSSDSLITITANAQVMDDGREVSIRYQSEVRPFSDNILSLNRFPN